nr:hypothetical protein [Tanacetum cinerariifolium]
MEDLKQQYLDEQKRLSNLIYRDEIKIAELKENFNDEFIKSSVEDRVPIPSESEGITDHMCDVPFHDNSLPLDVSKYQIEDFFESNNEVSSIDDDSFSIDNIDYVKASHPDYELVSSEVMEIVIPEVGGIDDDILLTIKDDILREKLLNVNLLIAKIEALNANPTPSFDCKTKSSSTSLKSLLEETNTFDNSLPKFEAFCFDVEEISSGSTITHSDIFLPEYEAFYDDHVKEISSGSLTTHSDSSFCASFIFDLSINRFPPTDRSDFYEFSDEHIPFISPPEYDCFLFKVEPNSRDFTKDVVEDNSPAKEPQVHNALLTHPTLQLNMKFQHSSEYLFTYVVWIFLPFLQYLDELKRLSNLEYRDEIKIAELTKNFNAISIEIRKKEKLLQQEQWAYLSTHPSKRLTSFCYDDDDDYDSAITPILSTEEPIDSLSMGDEHLDTIPATESDEVIKSSVENLVPIPSESDGIPEHMCDVPFHDNSPPLGVLNDQIEDFSESNNEVSSIDDDSFSIYKIDYVEASPPDFELVSSEVMEIVIPKVGGIDDDIPLTIKDDNLRDKLLNVNLLIATIEALNDNPTPSFDCKTKSSSTSLNSLLEETNTFHNSLPEFENFYFDLGEISSGSTTTHSDISLPDYEVFYFDDDHIKEISSGSTITHSEISLSEYDSFIFDLTHEEFV